MLQHLRTLFHGDQADDPSAYAEWIGQLIGDPHISPAAVLRLAGGEVEARNLIANIVSIGNQTTANYTVYGQSIFLHHPERTVIKTDELLLALGRIIRYNGAVGVSVLHHTWHVLLIAHENDVSLDDLPYLAAHDLHEAITLDQPTGHKQAVPLLAAIEEKWANHVHTSLGLSWPIPTKAAEALTDIDLLALGVEVILYDHPAALFILDRLNIKVHPNGTLSRGKYTATVPELPLEADTFIRSSILSIFRRRDEMCGFQPRATIG